MARTTMREVRRAAAEILGPWPMSTPDLVGALGDAGLDLGPKPSVTLEDALLKRATFVELSGRRWLALDRALDGLAWATVADAELAAEDCLAAAPDLELIAISALERGVPYGGPVETGEPRALFFEELDDGRDALVGPEGWLTEHAGRSVAVAMRNGACTVESLDVVPEPTGALVELVRSMFDAHCERRELRASETGSGIEVAWTTVDALWCEALAAERDLFLDVVIPRVDDVLALAGLQRRDGSVLDASCSWDDLDRLLARDEMADAWDLDDDELDETEMVLAASYGVMSGALDLDTFGADEDEAPRTSDDEAALRGAPAVSFLLALCLVKEKVARAFLGHHLQNDTDPEDLAEFARVLLEHLDAPEDTGVRWLLAWALNQVGDAVAAEAELERALRGGIDHALVLRDLAGFRSDRGDAPGTMALLERAVHREVGDFDDPGAVDIDDEIELLVGEVEEYARHRPAAPVGRNEPCPCGSGRKYKVCHLGTERHPLIDRGPWLYDKARRYLRNSQARIITTRLASLATDAQGGDASTFLAFVDTPLLADVALHEAAVFADFVAERDALLPDDEALTAAQWALTDRSVFEIKGMGDDFVLVRDLRSGDELEVTNVTPSERSRMESLLLGRPLPIGDTWRALSGFIDVPDAMRDAAIDMLDGAGDPFEVAAFIGRCLGPPIVTNTDGELLQFHELTYRIPDPSEARRALLEDDRVREQDDGSLVLAPSGVGSTLLLAIELSDRELVVHANSRRRAVMAQERIAELLPDAVLVWLEALDPEELHAERANAPGEVTTRSGDPDDPEVRAGLDDSVQHYERTWVDEPVPALHGLTPRQAMLDPVEREELDRLLAMMEDRFNGPGTMNPERVRGLLGL